MGKSKFIKLNSFKRAGNIGEKYYKNEKRIGNVSYEFIYQKTIQILEDRVLNESTLQYSWHKNIKHHAKCIQIWLKCKDLTSFPIISDMQIMPL